LKKNK
jgi:hypothetical protein